MAQPPTIKGGKANSKSIQLKDINHELNVQHSPEGAIKQALTN